MPQNNEAREWPLAALYLLETPRWKGKQEWSDAEVQAFNREVRQVMADVQTDRAQIHQPASNGARSGPIPR